MKQGRTWDSAAVPNVKINELEDLDVFRTYAVNSLRIDKHSLEQDDENLLEKLRLFGAFIKIGFFENDSDLLYQDEVHGNLFIQTERTIDLLMTKYLKAKISYEGIQRHENLPIPLEAIREAVLNAIVHKDYSQNIAIQISVYEDKLMIWNSGQLHQGWTVEKLFRKHESAPFNPEIANCFFRAGLIEAWGRGIEKMSQACINAGIQKPEILYEESGIWLTFNFKESSVKSSVKILDILKVNPNFTIPELALELSLTERAVEKTLKNLQASNQLRRVGSKKAGYWEAICEL